MIIGVQGSYMAQPFVYNPHCGFLSLNTHPLSPPCLFEHNCSFTAQCPLCFFSSVTACLPPSPCFLSTTTYPLPLPCFFQAWLTAPTIFLWAQMLVHWSHHIFSSLTACSPLPAHHSPYHIYSSTSACLSPPPCLFKCNCLYITPAISIQAPALAHHSCHVFSTSANPKVAVQCCTVPQFGWSYLAHQSSMLHSTFLTSKSFEFQVWWIYSGFMTIIHVIDPRRTSPTLAPWYQPSEQTVFLNVTIVCSMTSVLNLSGWLHASCK